MITYEQAVYFLDVVLRMPPTWKQLIHQDPLAFLTLYLKRHAIKVPFQNMEMSAVEPEKRWFPSEADLAAQGLSGKGGCCMHLNYFTMMVFRALGLDTFVVRGDHYSAPVAGTHCLVMVKLYGPKNVGTFMVEAGGYYPILEVIPMDSDKLPYKTLQAGGFPYEFREFAPGWIGKFHLGGGLMGGKYADKNEVLRTSWDLKPRGHWEFDYPMLETFTNPAVASPLRFPLLYRYFSNTEFRRLFPELPENANAKDKVLVTTRKALSKVGKVLAASGRPKVAESIVPKPAVKNEKSEVENGKSALNNKTLIGKSNITSSQNGTSKSKPTSTILTAPPTSNGKSTVASPTSTKPNPVIVASESEEDEYEVVTEEEVGTSGDDDDLEDPQHFVYAWKRRLVVGDAKSRKIIKNYETFEEMAEDVKKYFPMIPPAAVDKAMEAFNEFELLPTSYDSIL